jgi:hypothetical protein
MSTTSISNNFNQSNGSVQQSVISVLEQKLTNFKKFVHNIIPLRESEVYSMFMQLTVPTLVDWVMAQTKLYPTVCSSKKALNIAIEDTLLVPFNVPADKLKPNDLQTFYLYLECFFSLINNVTLGA